MLPVFLPHTVLDTPEVLALPRLDDIERRGRSALIALRDRAMAEGAHVLFVLWPEGGWTMLSVEPPADEAVTDACQLIPKLLQNLGALAEFERRASRGEYLGWLSLKRPLHTLH